MTKWSDWWQCENSHYINYPASYSDELTNLCWYFRGGGLYPSRIFAGVELVWNIDNLRPAVGYTVHYNWSSLLLDKNVTAHQTNQFSLQYLHQQRKNLHSCFDSSIFFAHTNQLGKSLFVFIWFVTTVFICREISLIQFFYIIIHVIHNFQHCLSHFAYYSLCSLDNS